MLLTDRKSVTRLQLLAILVAAVLLFMLVLSLLAGWSNEPAYSPV